MIADEWRDRAPKFSAWLSENIEECFTVYQLPAKLQKRLRTVNLLENTNREIRKRTRLVGIFPNEESLLRLATAVLQEIHDDWIAHIIPVISFPEKTNFQHKPMTRNNKTFYRQKVA